MDSESGWARGPPGATRHGYQSGAARPAFALGSRDIYPLPVPGALHQDKKLSRRVSQRVARAKQKNQKCVEAIAAFNWLSGAKSFSNSWFQPDDLQLEVLNRVNYLAGLCQEKASLDRIPSPEAALSALLRGRSEYGSDPPTALATCSLERISLPEDVSKAPPVGSLLDKDALRFLQCPEQMLKAGAQCDPDFQPYWDPRLRQDSGLYKRFILKLHKVGLLVYTTTPKCHCGVFFVKKSDGQRIRLIIDARGANMLFNPPPGVDLLTSDGFARIELVPPGHLSPGTKEFDDFMDGQKVGIGLSDVKDCFHRLRQPFWLSEYFCLDPVPAEWVGLVGTKIHGKLLSAGDPVWPAPGSLCMGFTWSLYFAQRVSERLMSMVPSLSASRLVNDRSGAIVFDQRHTVEGEASLHHYVYVDNLGLLRPITRQSRRVSARWSRCSLSTSCCCMPASSRQAPLALWGVTCGPTCWRQESPLKDTTTSVRLWKGYFEDDVFQAGYLRW